MKCQSCKLKPVEIIEPCDNTSYPYQLCNSCHGKLINIGLRPLEYFNLVASHGMTNLLNDDFYDEDGTASQAEIEVVSNRKLAFPEFDSIKNDPERLIDHSIVVWYLKDKHISALKMFDKPIILNSIKQRINANRDLAYRLYEVSAKVLGPIAADWIREEWAYQNLDNLMNYSECLAYCLPINEGFYLYTNELNKIDHPNTLSDKLMGLIYFQSDLSLVWIEKNINRVNNISNAWGYLAAASRFDWDRTKEWLKSGRPLSLVALDALVNYSVTSKTLNSTVWLKNNPKKLLNPDTIPKMNNVLNDYLLKDNVVRVRNSIAKIQSSWDEVLKKE